MRRLLIPLVLLTLLAAPLGADEEAARYFVDRGDKALEAGDPDDAERQFEKALTEAAGYPPALLGLARVSLARDDEENASARLEACLDACDRAGATTVATEVRHEAESLLARIDRPRLEYRETVEEYVQALLALARRSRKSSPDLARRCLNRVLAVDPDHVEAKAMLPSVAGAADTVQSGEAVDLFNGKDLEDWSAAGPAFEVRDGVLKARSTEHAYYVRTKKMESGDYTVIFEFRIPENLGKTPLLSLLFGMRAVYDRWELNVFDSKFQLAHYPGNEDGYERLDETKYYELTGGFDRKAWNVLKIVVESDSATFHVNGRKLFSRRAPTTSFDGCVGLVIQHCAAEFRRIAVIRHSSGD